MTSNLYPYSQLAEDPTSEIYIAWIDADTDRADHEQSLEYREKGTDEDYKEVDADKVEIPEGSGEHKHEVHLTDLESNTVYEANILCDNGFKSVEFKTMPTRLWKEELTMVNQSDVHITSTVSMDDETEMDDLADEEPDIYLFTGDLIHNAEVSSENTNGWIEWFRDYYSRLHEDLLIPIVFSVGNHEVGLPDPDELDDPDSQDPTVNYFQLFFSNIKDLDPNGENFGIIEIGNYLQIFIIDTMSAVPIQIREWIDENQPLSGNVLTTIPMHHQPILAGGERTSDDVERREALRDELASILADNPTVKFSLGGHIHLEKRSKPWTVVDEEPSDDYLSLKDGDEGYLVEADSDEEGITEFGDGYRNLRDEWDKWYLEYSINDGMDDAQYEVIKVSQEEVDIEVKRFNSSRQDKVSKEAFKMKTNTNQIGFIGGF